MERFFIQSPVVTVNMKSSVDNPTGNFVALLKSKKILVLAVIAVFLSPVFIRVVMVGPGHQTSFREEELKPEESHAVAASVLAEPLMEKESFETIERVIKAGSTAYALLIDAGLTPQEVLEVTRAFAGSADLTRCRPGESLAMSRGINGRVDSVAYRKGPLDIFRADRVGDGWNVSKEMVPYTVRVEKIEGVVESSLFQAMENLKENDSLSISLIDILAWEIDFAHESKSGDSFKVVVEKYYLDGRRVSYGPVLAAEYTAAGRTIRAYSLEDDRGGMDYFNEEGQSLKKSFLKSPLRYNRISSGYSNRRLHPVTRRVQPHYAIDYAAPSGTPVWSVADGVVRGINRDKANGRKVVISHPGDYKSYYLHLSRFARGLKIGKSVKQKQVIGYVGSTGLATGPHLDYRLQKRGRYINPVKEEFPRSEPVNEERADEFNRRRMWLDTYLKLSPAGMEDSLAARL